MLAYADVQTFAMAGLTAAGYGSVDGPPMPMLNMGPAALPRVAKLSPNAIVVLTVGNGIGPTTEALFDQTFVVVRVMGPQNDYAGAESLAHTLDALFMGIGTLTPSMMGSTRVLYATRNAPPQLVDQDAADRYHFQTTYITEAAR